jgi:hypothetical protein
MSLYRSLSSLSPVPAIRRRLWGRVSIQLIRDYVKCVVRDDPEASIAEFKRPLAAVTRAVGASTEAKFITARSCLDTDFISAVKTTGVWCVGPTYARFRWR